MIKIWAKVYKGEKIIRQAVIEKDGDMDYSLFFEYLKELCELTDVPCPILIKHHIFSYAKYNFVAFTKNDFMESVPFTKFVLENINR